MDTSSSAPLPPTPPRENDGFRTHLREALEAARRDAAALGNRVRSGEALNDAQRTLLTFQASATGAWQSISEHWLELWSVMGDIMQAVTQTDPVSITQLQL